MMTIEVAMLKERFDSLFSKYSEEKIKVISTGGDFIRFDITISNPFDVIEIFSAGVSYGINMALPKSE
jgi:hypothetical protein